MSADFVKKTGEIFRSGKPIEERLREFTAEVGSFLSGGVCSVLLFDRDTEDFYLRATSLRYAPSPETIHFSSAGTLEDLALREQRVVSLTEVHRAPNSRLRGDMMLFPLISAEEPLGVLVVQSASPGGVDPGQASTLGDAVAILADSIGVSLREESTALRMTKIAAINEAGINIISTLDLQRLLKLVATSACLIMEAESCVIRLLDAQTGKYAIREFYGMKTESDQKDLFRMDKKAVVGAGLAPAHRVAIALAVRMGGGALIGWLGARALGLAGPAAGVALVTSAMPAAVNTALLTRKYAAGPEFAAALVAAGTVVSLLLLPLLAALVR